MQTTKQIFKTFSVMFKLKTAFEDSQLDFSLSILACAEDSCLSEIPLIVDIQFDKTHERRKRETEGIYCYSFTSCCM